MNKIERAQELYEINIDAYVDDLIDNRNNPFKSILVANKERIKAEASHLTSQHLIGRIIDYNTLWDASLHKKKFINLYNAPSHERAFIKNYRDKYLYAQCPFCGCPSCNTLDHYYSKSEFPQFALIPDNLIPSCSICNDEKDTIKSDSDNQRFIHPCFDDFGVRIIYSIFLQINSGYLDIEIIPSDRLSIDNKSIVEFHIRNLKLKERLFQFLKGILKLERAILLSATSDGSISNHLSNLETALSDTILNGSDMNWNLVIKNEICQNIAMREVLLMDWK